MWICFLDQGDWQLPGLLLLAWVRGSNFGHLPINSTFEGGGGGGRVPDSGHFRKIDRTACSEIQLEMYQVNQDEQPEHVHLLGIAVMLAVTLFRICSWSRSIYCMYTGAYSCVDRLNPDNSRDCAANAWQIPSAISLKEGLYAWQASGCVQTWPLTIEELLS